MLLGYLNTCGGTPPSKREREKLAIEVNWTSHGIYQWFKNRIAKTNEVQSETHQMRPIVDLATAQDPTSFSVAIINDIVNHIPYICAAKSTLNPNTLVNHENSSSATLSPNCTISQVGIGSLRQSPHISQSAENIALYISSRPSASTTSSNQTHSGLPKLPQQIPLFTSNTQLLNSLKQFYRHHSPENS